ncbi:MAG TPA: ergothioneine biosynthesis protein EgtC [Mycobacteriales bacterium]|nr:ergothioneine biosynthesis protein EgtC [Mycobacteriales bacterium]
MCRHIAYLGPPLALGALLTDPPYSLVRQSFAPRRQRHGTVNVDGFGVGWYVDGDPVPARYRRDRPIWSDEPLLDLARVVTSGAVLAAVRDGTPGLPYGEAACAPFGQGRHLFSHNGAVPGWQALAETTLGPAELLRLPVATDSALLWALVLRTLAAGKPLAEAVAATVAAAAPLGGRLNLLVTDGAQIVATTYGESLCWRPFGTAGRPAGVVVASEPYDDEPGWHDVPDRYLLQASPDGVHINSMES